MASSSGNERKLESVVGDMKYPMMSIVIVDMAGAELAALVADVQKPVSVFRAEASTLMGCPPSQFKLLLGHVALNDKLTLAASGVVENTPQPVNIVVVMLDAQTEVGAFARFNEEHLRIIQKAPPGQALSSVATKIGRDRDVTYAAIAERCMEPNTGTWWWSFRILQTHFGVIAAGVCSTDADPMQPGLRFTSKGCAFECWTALFYDMSDTNRRPINTGWPRCNLDDVITFSLDTTAGVLTMYLNGAKLGVLSDRLKGLCLHAHIELENFEDMVELFSETVPIEDENLCLLHNVGVGMLLRFSAEHLRIMPQEAPGQASSSVATKIGRDRGATYAAIAERCMEPNTGTWWWSFRILQTRIGVIAAGVCRTDADPMQPGLHFTSKGCAFECWTALFYDMSDTSRRPINTGWPRCNLDDVIAFSLDTTAGVLTMYLNGAKLGVLSDRLKGLRLHAHIELEHSEDSVELFGETVPIDD